MMDEKERFDLVIMIGETMVENGGEISRATETMETVASQYGVREFKAFAIANGIFASALSKSGTDYSCKITCVPIRPIRLSLVDALNNLSRKISENRCTPEDARKAVEEIRNRHFANGWKTILSAGLGSFCFCYLFLGSMGDCLSAFIAGGFAYAFIKRIAPKFTSSSLSTQIIGAMIAALINCALYYIGLGNNLDRMIIGSIFPMTPGVALTISIRNFLENDYLTGLVRLVDALITAGCLAGGVGLAIQGWNLVFGGAIL
ncbi:MAG: threonine/serine exporter family protein [Clostridiales bacterium]|jgi:uncharacterized membrane protein YjjP (DUF1212 family)|nr:threonine/serine exporter family protein [Clostridiales bacterium]MCI2161342.1 threonine/serine exporter family protein [Oscillospiraceae bacterium]MCI1962449.1 threonine/serine exporter family protein [Clostridiales bacterium]MCI2022717.1 threonine/serine exporter family protein [Clostridiales bacterium]MCI2026968.1 threonine/serine exporter family protein [Clostridiales bacterium]